MRSFAKIIHSRKDGIALSLSDLRQSRLSGEFKTWQICLLPLFAKIKFSRTCPNLQKIFVLVGILYICSFVFVFNDYCNQSRPSVLPQSVLYVTRALIFSHFPDIDPCTCIFANERYHKMNSFFQKYASIVDVNTTQYACSSGQNCIRTLSLVYSSQRQKLHGRIQRGGGGRGSGHPLKNYRNIGYPSNIDPDSGPENSQSQHSMLGNHGPASETPFKWRFTCGPMMAHL